MRTLTLQYAGACRKCGDTLPVGSTASYERRIGVFCPGCTPTDTEELRRYREEAAERRAERLEQWAASRRQKARLAEAPADRMRGDIAFWTQPGRIPYRDRVMSGIQRAAEHAQMARAHEDKAQRVRRGVRVAGDAERAREERRERARAWVRAGSRVESPLWGRGTVERVNRKTVTVRWERGNRGKEDLSWIRNLDDGGQNSKTH
jgi:uncharacterized Zn finger protein (UPF0148 family)